MNATAPSIDTTRLLKVRRIGNKIVAQCPACNATGGDRRGEHFFLNTADGKFGCGAFPGDTEHRREIFALVGIRGERRPDPERDRRWRMERDEKRHRKSARASLVETAKSKRDCIIARWGWNLADVWESSQQRIDCQLVESDPRWFIASLFPENATVWTGEVHESGQAGNQGSRWKTVAEWQDEQRVGPMTTPATWKSGTLSRSAGNVAAAPYVVLDFDGLDGRKPKTPEEIEAHIQTSLALIRWIREGLNWKLSAILFTGSVSLHAWFMSPPKEVLESLKATAIALGIDAGLIDHPEHPCRLPGQFHAKTGELSRALWLQNPM